MGELKPAVNARQLKNELELEAFCPAQCAAQYLKKRVPALEPPQKMSFNSNKNNNEKTGISQGMETYEQKCKLHKMCCKPNSLRFMQLILIVLYLLSLTFAL